MNLTRIAGICLIACLLWSVGCESSPQAIDTSSGAPRQAPPVTELVAQNRPPIPDLPVPIGFKLDYNKSRDYAPGGARFVDHTYKGSADVFAVKRFYERQMKTSRWVLTMSKFVRGEVTLDFEKETERCRISIDDPGMLRRTCIKVDLWTSGQVMTPGNE